MVSASSTRRLAVRHGIRNAAATSVDASDAAACGTKCATCSGSSSLVMQFFRASTAASRIGSPATNGTANADSNRICVAASSDSAFSDATTASTSAAPVIAVGSAPVNASKDSGVAGRRSELRPFHRGGVAAGGGLLVAHGASPRRSAYRGC